MNTADRAGVPRAIEWSLQLYAVLVRAYPKRFRAACGREMSDAFAADVRRAFRYGRAPGVVRLWLPTLYDFVVPVVPERLGFARWSGRHPESRGPRHHVPLRRRRRENLDGQFRRQWCNALHSCARVVQATGFPLHQHRRNWGTSSALWQI